MKFLCVSDQVDPLIYSTTVKDRYDDIDAVFCAGDLSLEYQDYIVTTLGKPTFFVFGNHDLKDFWMYNKRHKFGEVPRNAAMDGLKAMEMGHGGDYASNKVLRCKSLRFTFQDGSSSPLLVSGVSGSMRYNNGQDQFTEGEMKWQLIKLIPGLMWNKFRYGRYCDVFLTHASPRHIHDKEDPCHIGFQCFNWFIDKFKPSLFIHGHIHLYDLQAVRYTQCDTTAVVNAFSHLVVELDLQKQDDSKGGEFVPIVHIHSDR